MMTTIVQAEVENVVIIGSGPAGYTAAIYCARANMKPILFEVGTKPHFNLIPPPTPPSLWRLHVSSSWW